MCADADAKPFGDVIFFTDEVLSTTRESLLLLRNQALATGALGFEVVQIADPLLPAEANMEW